MRKSPLKRIGKTGQANIEARKKIAEIAEEKGLNYCELNLNGCLGVVYLAPAHRHKRAWYKGDVEKLSDYKQWICSCVYCHNLIEHDAVFTEYCFKKLRGDE